MNKCVLKDCSICLEKLNIKNIEQSIELDCNHFFHTNCIKKWCKTCFSKINSINKFNNVLNCPLCRQTISDENLDILDLHQFTQEYKNQKKNIEFRLFSDIFIEEIIEIFVDELNS